MAGKNAAKNGHRYVFEIVAPNGAVLPPVVHAKSWDEAAEEALKLMGASVRLARNDDGEPLKVQPDTRRRG